MNKERENGQDMESQGRQTLDWPRAVREIVVGTGESMGPADEVRVGVGTCAC